MTSLYHVLVLALGTASFTQGKPYYSPNMGYNNGCIGGGGVNEFGESTYNQMCTDYVNECECYDDICENNHNLEDCYSLFEENCLDECSSNYESVCDTECVKKTKCSTNDYGSMNNMYNDYGNLNEFGNNYMVEDGYFNEGMGCNGMGNYGMGPMCGGCGPMGGFGAMGGCGCGGMGNYGGGYGASGSNCMNQGGYGYGNNYGAYGCDQNEWGTSSCEECEEICTSHECVSDSMYDINSCSVFDESSNYIDCGNSLESVNSCVNCAAGNDYCLSDCQSNSVNENLNGGNFMGNGLYF